MFWGDRTWIGEQKNQLQVCCSHFHAVAAVSALRALKYSWLGMGLKNTTPCSSSQNSTGNIQKKNTVAFEISSHLQPLLILEKRPCSLSLAFPENCGLTFLRERVELAWRINWTFSYLAEFCVTAVAIRGAELWDWIKSGIGV